MAQPAAVSIAALPFIHDSANITYSYSLAVEELAGIEVPRRGQFIGALTSELDRMDDFTSV
jgi:NADH-quinone oxidoreductase subunit D